MAFERTAITEASSPQSATPMPIMREDRVIDMYDGSKKRIAAAQAVVAGNQAAGTAPPAATTPNGRPTINSEAAPGEELPKTEETITLSPQMAALARREQRFRHQEMALREKEKAFEARLARATQLEELDKKLAAKDFSAIESRVPYDDYTNYLIEKAEGVNPDREAIKALRADLDGFKTDAQKQVERQFEAAVNERKKMVADLVETKPELAVIKKLNALKAGSGNEAVVQHILDTWEHDQVDLSPEQAAKEVAQAVVAQAQRARSLVEETTPEVAPAETKTLPPPKAPVKTIMNNMSAGGESPKRLMKPLSEMTDSERYQEARRRGIEKLNAQQRR